MYRMVRTVIALVVAIMLQVGNCLYAVAEMAEYANENASISEEVAIEIAIADFEHTTGFTRQEINEYFTIHTSYYRYDNGVQTWNVYLHYALVEDALCFYGVEMDAVSGRVYSSGPKRFREMLCVYNEYDAFRDYSKHYVAIWEETFGTPFYLWDYRQTAEYVQEHYSLGYFCNASDATLPEEFDIPYEQALEMATDMFSVTYGTDQSREECIYVSSTFHTSYILADVCDGNRERYRAWEFNFYNESPVCLGTVYVLSPSGVTGILRR